MTEAEAFITDDGVLVTGVGVFDPIDVKNIGGRRVLSTAMMLEYVQADLASRPPDRKPANADESFEELKRVAREAPETYLAIKRQVEPFVLASPGLVTAIRRKRVDERYSWRAVARWGFNEPRLNYGRLNPPAWWPPSNQLAGMALCEIAATLDGEDYRDPPWNPK
jgi:hypothetical protein